jgi:DNA repair exonuclease SbcCD nuclease subunit|tara:strand:+ start:878 stop:1810 length:933 start_codon:yes stop_codon:yes gene_type:complete
MKKENKPTAILTADWHIRGDRPVCRTDNYIETQKRKIEFIIQKALNYECPILIAGDVGHRPIWGDRLLNQIIEILQWDWSWCVDVPIIAIAGQHDLPHHRLDEWKEGGLGVLSKSVDKFKVINKPTRIEGAVILPFHYSNNIIKLEQETTDKTVALLHTMVIKSQKDKLWEGQETHSAKWYLRKFPCYDLIVTGDNHQSFSVEYEGRWLINCGSLTRMSANQIDHKPSVYLWYAEDNSIERVYLPIEKDIISREHIEVAEQRDSRIESFVNRLKETEELGLSFENNIEEFFRANRTRKRIVEKVWESMNG